ncbi:MAG: Mut7-C RNAse domain-containing protein [Candidatus Micrarchaeota archaeon]
MLFVADMMLKKLARWLRILGVDVSYPKDSRDDYLLELTREKGAVLLTMDVALVQRAKQQNLHAFLVPTRALEEQLAVILHTFNISLASFPSRIICPTCNGALKETGKEEVIGKVPEKTLASHDKFWLCTSCSAVFWEGSHWEKIKETVEKVKVALANQETSVTSST